MRKQPGYVSWLMQQAGLRPRHDRLLLWGTALAIVCAFLEILYLASRLGFW